MAIFVAAKAYRRDARKRSRQALAASMGKLSARKYREINGMVEAPWREAPSIGLITAYPEAAAAWR